MNKITALLLALFFAAPVFAKKVKDPYCFQGHYTDTSTYIWCMMPDKEAAGTTFTYGNASSGFQPVNGQLKFFNGMTYGHLRIGHLSPASSYELRRNGEKILDFRTADTHKDSLDLLIGSCAMMTFGWQWMLRPKSHFPIYYHMAKEPSDAMLWMGDNLYFIMEANSDKKQTKKYIRTRQVPEMVHFLQSMPQYAMWDDHDFGPNNSDGTFPYKHISFKNFNDFWANPAPVDSADGVYYSISYPQADIFMMDNRFHAVSGQRYFSDQQMQWLLGKLQQSDKPFKFIVTGCQANNKQTHHETLYSTGEYEKIISYIRDQHIPGVIFINGDRHHTEIFRHQEEGIYPIYEFTNSPLTSIPTNIKRKNGEYNNPARIKGVTKGQVYGKISVYPSLKGDGSWVCRLATINRKGELVWDVWIESSELNWQPRVSIKK